MKKILGIHPLLLSLLAIIIALNLYDRLNPKQKDSVVEATVHKSSIYPTTKPVTQNEPVFYNLDKQAENGIGLFNHQKWYKTKSEANSNAGISRSQPSSLPAKPIVPIVSATPITPKPLKTIADKPKPEKITIVQTPKPIVEPTHTPPTNHTPVAIPEPIAPPPEPKLNYIGKYGDKDRQYVFLEVDGNSKAVGLGETIDGHTKITGIEKNKIQLTDIRTGSTKTLSTE